MKIGIMQAYFFPYIGYFQLIDASDEFILYEHVAFRKKSWITKNRILDKGRKLPVEIRIPVIKKCSHKNISQIEISGSNWKRPLLKMIYYNYKRAAYFKEVYPLIENCIQIDTSSLHDYNSAIINEICNYLDLKTNIKYKNEEFLKLEVSLLNEVNIKEVKSLRIVEICKQQKAHTYINPAGGIELYDKAYFKKNNLSLYFINTKEYSYNQFNMEYTPHLSIIDVLMHNGKEGTKKMIKNYSLI